MKIFISGLMILVSFCGQAQTLLTEHKLKTDDMTMFAQFSDGTMNVGLYDGLTSRKVLVLDEKGNVSSEYKVKLSPNNTKLYLHFVGSPDSKHKFFIKGFYDYKQTDSFLFEELDDQAKPVDLDFGVKDKSFRVHEIIMTKSKMFLVTGVTDYKIDTSYYSLYEMSYDNKKLQIVQSNFAKCAEQNFVAFVGMDDSRLVFSKTEYAFEDDKKQFEPKEVIFTVYSYRFNESKTDTKTYQIALEDDLPVMFNDKLSGVTTEYVSFQPITYSVLMGDKYKVYFRHSNTGIVRLVNGQIEIHGLLGSHKTNDLEVNRLFSFSEEGIFQEFELKDELVFKAFQFSRTAPFRHISSKDQHVYYTLANHSAISNPERITLTCELDQGVFNDVKVERGGVDNYDKEMMKLKLIELEQKGKKVELNENMLIPVCIDPTRIVEIDKKLVRIYSID